MNGETVLVRGTAWIAFAFYVLSQVALRGRREGRGRKGWWLSAAGFVVLVVHFGLAFHFRYGWSQEAAVVDTARQTAAVTGFNSGVGVFVNYGFALVWLMDLVRWRGRMNGAAVAGKWDWFVRGVFLFMFVNAAVIFVPGAMKWVGVIGCVTLAVTWFVSRKN